MVFRKGMPDRTEKIESFMIDTDFECYCGRKINIKYDEATGEKNTTCKYCGYSHLDFVFSIRKHAEMNTADFLKQFFE